MGQIWACEEVQFQEIAFVVFIYATILQIYFEEETKKQYWTIYLNENFTLTSLIKN